MCVIYSCEWIQCHVNKSGETYSVCKLPVGWALYCLYEQVSTFAIFIHDIMHQRNHASYFHWLHRKFHDWCYWPEIPTERYSFSLAVILFVKNLCQKQSVLANAYLMIPLIKRSSYFTDWMEIPWLILLSLNFPNQVFFLLGIYYALFVLMLYADWIFNP